MRSLRQNYEATVIACYIGYITQAIVNVLAPLLFLTFQRQFGISLARITLLSTVNFGVQLLVDLASPRIVGRVGYRAGVIVAHVCAAAGLLCLGLLPGILPNPYIGMLISVVLYAIGGGLIEVLVSPIVEAAPTKNKEAAMSLLHSFYCWGVLAVILLSTAFFSTAGIEHWPALSSLWAIIPICNNCLFSFVPIRSPEIRSKGKLSHLYRREYPKAPLWSHHRSLQVLRNSRYSHYNKW